MNETTAAKNEFGTALNMARPSLGDDCPAKEWYRAMARGMTHMAEALDVINTKLDRLQPPGPQSGPRSSQASTLMSRV